jgi:hypothetical protein
MLHVKRFEIMNGGIGRDRLRIEFFVLKPIKDWSNLLRGIVTNGLRALHEQARLCQNLLFLFGLEDRCSYKSKKDKSQSSTAKSTRLNLVRMPIRPTSTTPAYQLIYPQRAPNPELKRRSVTLSISMTRNQNKCDRPDTSCVRRRRGSGARSMVEFG